MKCLLAPHLQAELIPFLGPLLITVGWALCLTSELEMVHYISSTVLAMLGLIGALKTKTEQVWRNIVMNTGFWGIYLACYGLTLATRPQTQIGLGIGVMGFAISLAVIDRMVPDRRDELLAKSGLIVVAGEDGQTLTAADGPLPPKPSAAPKPPRKHARIIRILSFFFSR